MERSGHNWRHGWIPLTPEAVRVHEHKSVSDHLGSTGAARDNAARSSATHFHLGDLVTNRDTGETHRLTGIRTDNTVQLRSASGKNSRVSASALSQGFSKTDPYDARRLPEFDPATGETVIGNRMAPGKGAPMPADLAVQRAQRLESMGYAGMTPEARADALKHVNSTTSTGRPKAVPSMASALKSTHPNAGNYVGGPAKAKPYFPPNAPVVRTPGSGSLRKANAQNDVNAALSGGSVKEARAARDASVQATVKANRAKNAGARRGAPPAERAPARKKLV